MAPSTSLTMRREGMVTCTYVPLRPSMRPVTWMSLPPVPGNITVNAAPSIERRLFDRPHGRVRGVAKVGEELRRSRSEHESALVPVAPRLPASADHDSPGLRGWGWPPDPLVRSPPPRYPGHQPRRPSPGSHFRRCASRYRPGSRTRSGGRIVDCSSLGVGSSRSNADPTTPSAINAVAINARSSTRISGDGIVRDPGADDLRPTGHAWRSSTATRGRRCLISARLGQRRLDDRRGHGLRAVGIEHRLEKSIELEVAVMPAALR